MKRKAVVKVYSPREEKINIISHAAGIVSGCLALVFLVLKAMDYGDLRHIMSFTVYGISIILLFTASTLYHSRKGAEARKRFKVFDHSAIYVLIAGTYTPFTLVTLQGTLGWVLFGFLWGLALTGIIMKFFFTGRFNMLSTIMYVLMGWIVVFFLRPLSEQLPREGLILLICGGVSYTVGAVLYSIRKIPYNHASFHILVLAGALFHLIAVYIYV